MLHVLLFWSNFTLREIEFISNQDIYILFNKHKIHVTAKYTQLPTIIFKFNHAESFVFVPTSYDLFPYPKSTEISSER